MLNTKLLALVRDEDGVLLYATEAELMNAAANILYVERTSAAPPDDIDWLPGEDVNGHTFENEPGYAERRGQF